MLGLVDPNKDPGTENLNLRAYFATVVGPKRIAHGARTAKQIPRTGDGKSVQLASNAGKQHECVYVEVWLPQATFVKYPTGLWLSFSGDDAVGNTADRVLLAPGVGQPNTRYTTVLLPNEQLFAIALSLVDGAAIPEQNVNVVVGQVIV